MLLKIAIKSNPYETIKLKKINTDDNKISKLFKKYIKKPFIIAELSANHDGSILKAKKLISIAKDLGLTQ